MHWIYLHALQQENSFCVIKQNHDFIFILFFHTFGFFCFSMLLFKMANLWYFFLCSSFFLLEKKQSTIIWKVFFSSANWYEKTTGVIIIQSFTIHARTHTHTLTMSKIKKRTNEFRKNRMFAERKRSKERESEKKQRGV